LCSTLRSRQKEGVFQGYYGTTGLFSRLNPLFGDEKIYPKKERNRRFDLMGLKSVTFDRFRWSKDNFDNGNQANFWTQASALQRTQFSTISAQMSSGSGREDSDSLSDDPSYPAALQAPSVLPQAFRNMFKEGIVKDGTRFAKRSGPKKGTKKVQVRGGTRELRDLDVGKIVDSKRVGSR
jgi:hypothetical protein